MGSLYFWGHSIQEMGGNVVEGRSIYGVVVIDGSLYSILLYLICSCVDQLKQKLIYITCNLCAHMYGGV